MANAKNTKITSHFTTVMDHDGYTVRTCIRTDDRLVANLTELGRAARPSISTEQKNRFDFLVRVLDEQMDQITSPKSSGFCIAQPYCLGSDDQLDPADAIAALRGLVQILGRIREALTDDITLANSHGRLHLIDGCLQLTTRCVRQSERFKALFDDTVSVHGRRVHAVRFALDADHPGHADRNAQPIPSRFTECPIA